MMKNYAFLAVALMAGLTPLLTRAAKLGDPAAPLTIQEWLLGTPVDVTDGKNVYVVEFWAAATKPSLAVVPLLNDIQKRYRKKGVIVVGVTDEPVKEVKPFVEQQPGRFAYSLAADDQRKTFKAYLRAYGQSVLPHAFVVGKDRKVLWHGHPLAGLTNVLDQIVSGKYDLQAAMRSDALRLQTEEFCELSRKGDPKARELGKKLLSARSNDVPGLCEFAYLIATDVQNKNRLFDLAEEALSMAEKGSTNKSAQVAGTRGVVLYEMGRQQEGIALLKQAVEVAKDNREKSRYLQVLDVIQRRQYFSKPATNAAK
jgi:tetratricopeptide (TPR) repeat protein